MTKIDFWSGNRSEIRKKYEREVVQCILNATLPSHGSFELIEHETTYSKEEEAQTFRMKNHHLLVTVAGNQKFESEEKIIIPQPILFNLMGSRIAIVLQKNKHLLLEAYHQGQLGSLQVGIPTSWSDAAIFRKNGYQVVEEGSYEDVFDRLVQGRFDYVSFGANEVESILEQAIKQYPKLCLEPKLVLQYPLPLVFYVHPRMPMLAERMNVGLQKIIDSGELAAIFQSYYSQTIHNLHLATRYVVTLKNPFIPSNLNPLPKVF